MANTKRLRDLGLSIGPFPVGPSNTIVDVPGVRVGHCDIRGRSAEGKPLHTGVTAIVPGSGNLHAAPLPAGVDVFNGFGKSAGLVQVQELGQIETPIFLTTTLNVGKVWDGVMALILEQNPKAMSVNPLVLECHDGRFSDSRARPAGESHVRAAYASASERPPALGCVGAGSGTILFGYKGGLGSSSRLVATRTLGEVRLGVMTHNNFGGKLQWNGRLIPSPVAKGGDGGLPGPNDRDAGSVQSGGSVIVVVATDAAVAPNVLRRIARRVWGGIARVGSRFGHGSGDVAVAFSLPSPDGRCPDQLGWRVDGTDLSLLFEAAADATEESVWDALLLAEDTVGVDGTMHRAFLPEQLMNG